MTFLIGILARWGVPEPLRKALATLIAAVSLIALCGALWGIWLWRHDKAVIAKHEAGITQAIAESTDSANAAANAAAIVRAAENARADERNAAAIAKAQASDPAGVKQQAGPATRAVLDQLRRK